MDILSDGEHAIADRQASSPSSPTTGCGPRSASMARQCRQRGRTLACSVTIAVLNT